MKKWVFILLSIVFPFQLSAQNIDKIYNAMTVDERISLLFMAEVNTTVLANDAKDLKKNYNYSPGFVLATEEIDSAHYAIFNDYLKAQKYIPISFIDEKALVGMPVNLALAATQSNAVIKSYASALGKSIGSAGFDGLYGLNAGLSHQDALPLEISNSFGEDWEDAAQKLNAYNNALRENGIEVAPVGFPGYYSPRYEGKIVIEHDKNRLLKVEGKAFADLMGQKVNMIGLSDFLAATEINTAPQSFFLQSKFIEDVVRKEMGYKDLIMSPKIKSYVKWHNAKNGEIELEALMAGCNVIVSPENPSAAIRKIKNELKKNNKLQKHVENSVKLVLKYRKTELKVLSQPVLDDRSIEILSRYTITVLDSDKPIIPIRDLGEIKIASVQFGTSINNELSIYLDKYARIKHFVIKDKFTYYDKFAELVESLKSFDLVIINLNDQDASFENKFGLGDNIPKFIKTISEKKQTILTLQGNPSILNKLPKLPTILAYEKRITNDHLIPQVLFGGKPAEGKVPLTVGEYPLHSGINTKPIDRLHYAYPEEADMNSQILNKIDEVVAEALKIKATPGCQVLVTRHGKIVFDKSYGYLSYDSSNTVENSSIYDVASITKVAATLQAVMMLAERDIIDINKKASYYLTDLRGSNKEDLFISDILTHQAGLTPYIPYWSKTMDKNGLNEFYYCTFEDEWFCHMVAPGIYSMKSMEDSLWKWTIDSDLRRPQKDGTFAYKYSDLGFYIMKKIVERVTRQPIEIFLDQNIYQPMGMSKLTFFPLAYFNDDEIAPTENDQLFRGGMIRGTVHDQGAAMFGGVGGHAGLFSNALELGKLMQMNMNGGRYGGVQYLKPTTVPAFAKNYFKDNRRGLGWDKPVEKGSGPTSVLCSYSTFGHTGFTGTAMWADPEYDLVYVFLSNRIHPDAENRKLIKQNIRTRIQDIIYESIFINDIKSLK